MELPMQCGNENAIISNGYFDYITDYFFDESMENTYQDYCFLQVNERYYVNYINRSQLPDIRMSDFYYYGIPGLYGLLQNEFNTLNLAETGIYQAQQSPLQLTGKQVLIGFVDTGIRYTDEVFLDEFGNTRIEAIWDQSLQIPQRAPEGFFYGSEFTREDINEALTSENLRDVVPSWDDNGHGSRMAAVAAGSNLGMNTFIGAAPDANILVVKLKPAKEYLREFYLINDTAEAFQENDIMLACKYLLSYARRNNAPLVIVLGIGTNLGDHAGNSPLGRYISELNTQRNVSIIVAAGNEGNANHHYLGNIGANTNGVNLEQTAYENVEIRVGEGEKGFICELWGASPDVYEIGVVSPGGERIPRISFNYKEGRSYDFVYERTVIDINVALVEEFTSQELIFMRFEDPTPGVWTITVYSRGVLNSGIFHMWLPLTEFLSSETYFFSPNPYTTITEPGMAQDVFCVGAYNSANGSFAFFSGRGNNRLGFTKPAMVAPGIGVYTPWGTVNGTSISAAYVAGAVADFMQWAIIEGNESLISGTGIRGYFVQGADRNPDQLYPNREWGYGTLNLDGVFDQLRR